MLRSLLLIITMLALALPCAQATTVVPPDFESMVQNSDYVVHGVVTQVTCHREDRNGSPRIITRVHFDPIEIVAGAAPDRIVLELLGGTIDGQTLTVSGQPQFAVGDEEILFVHRNGRSISPLYAMMFGRYAVRPDPTTGEKRVQREDGSGLPNVEAISAPLRSAHATKPTAPVAGMTPAAFKSLIRSARQSTTPPAARP
ncbi:hypothetical protein [Synoicihabitans lomoniglobus]|uniref:Uncharacterized protein n=1 Tax=Synoicihabitans lomoniglobus TaxID=2909285 RepID=A0AAE9ZW43_9BACT|nr:hypothetical protein [Opitutaceae bacterium LMO-M01]WED65217.1 hypothetical protein PXH66_23000 [Opitutaceae bacterium LMO-M01]